MTDPKLKRNVQDILKKMNSQYREIPDGSKADDKLVKLFFDVIFDYSGEGEGNNIAKKQVEVILGSLKSVIVALLMTQLKDGEKETAYQTGQEAKAVLDIGKPKEKWT